MNIGGLGPIKLNTGGQQPAGNLGVITLNSGDNPIQPVNLSDYQNQAAPVPSDCPDCTNAPSTKTTIPYRSACDQNNYPTSLVYNNGTLTLGRYGLPALFTTIPIVDGSETKIIAGSGILVTGSGTTLDPYVIVNLGGSGGGDGNNYPTSLSYDSNTGILTLGRSGLSSLTTTITIPPSDGSETIVTVGAGLSISGTGTSLDPYLITNTSPDQVVALTEGAGISITGTYPNFTIAAIGGEPTPISSLLPAISTNTIDNLNYAQVWKWDTLSGQAGLTLSSATGAGPDLSILKIQHTGVASGLAGYYYGQQIIMSGNSGLGDTWGLSVVLTGQAYNGTGIRSTVSLTSANRREAGYFTASGSGGLNAALRLSSSGGSVNYAIWINSGSILFDYWIGGGTQMLVVGNDGVVARQAIPVYDGSETKLTAGTNVTITGTGTIADPYVINSSGGGGSEATTASNGLSLSGVDVRLGGPLTIPFTQVGSSSQSNIQFDVDVAYNLLTLTTPSPNYSNNQLNLYADDTYTNVDLSSKGDMTTRGQYSQLYFENNIGGGYLTSSKLRTNINNSSIVSGMEIYMQVDGSSNRIFRFQIDGEGRQLFINIPDISEFIGSPSFYMPLSVNGNFADAAGNITISAGGNVVDTLDATLGAGNETDDKIVFNNTTTGVYENMWMVPYNSGTSYGAKGTASYFSSGWASFNVNGSGRPDVVATIFGYNHEMGGGRKTTDDAGMGMRVETHYESGGDLLEMHLPAFTDKTGIEHRLMSWYAQKTGSSAGGPRIETDALELFKWGDQLTGYASIEQRGQIVINAAVDGGVFPRLVIGSLLGTINGVSSSNWQIEYRSQGDTAYIGHTNTTLGNNSETVGVLRTMDNVWIGVEPGYGGGVNDQRTFLLAGYQRIVNTKSGVFGLQVIHDSTYEYIATFGTSSTGALTIAKQGIFVANGTTANRPSTFNGAFRYNTDTHKYEGVVSGTWVNFATGSGFSVTNETDNRVITSSGTGTGNAEENMLFDGATLTVRRPTAGTAPHIHLTRQSDAPSNSEVAIMWVEPPIANSETMRWEMTSQLSANDDLAYTNHVIKQGFNILNNYPTNAGNYTSMESNWFSGGANYLEYHYVVALPNLTQSRLFSSTFVRGADFASSTNQWDFRATTFQFMNMTETASVGIGASQGVNPDILLSINGTLPTIQFNDSANVTKPAGTIQYTSSKFIFSRAVQSNDQDINGFNFIANNVGGSTGLAQYGLINDDGNGAALLKFGTAFSGGRANDLILVNGPHYPFRSKINGNVMINALGQFDNGEGFQVYASAWFNGTVKLDVITQDDALTQILVRDGVSGQIKYRSAGTLGGSAYTFGNGLTESGGTVTLGDATFNANATFNHSGNARFIHTTSAALADDNVNYIRELRPSEYGTNAAVGPWYETLGESQTGQEGSPTARKNVVWSFGYNFNGSEIIAGEGYMRMGMESNYRPGGGQEWFEFHAPEVRYRNGQVSRWWSVIADKNNATDARHLWDGSSFSFRKVDNTAIVYASFSGNTASIRGDEITFLKSAGTTDYMWRMNLAGADSYLYNQAGSAFIQTVGSLYLQSAGTVEINATTNIAGSVTLKNAMTMYSGVASDEFSFKHTGGAYGSSYATIGLNESNSTVRNTSFEGAALLFDTRGITEPLRIQTQAVAGSSQTAMSFSAAGYTFLKVAPQQDDALTQVLVRDGSTGQIKYRAASTLAGASFTVSNESDNRVITSTGAGTANAEANLTFNGSNLVVNATSTFTGDITIDPVSDWYMRHNDIASSILIGVEGVTAYFLYNMGTRTIDWGANTTGNFRVRNIGRTHVEGGNLWVASTAWVDKGVGYQIQTDGSIWADGTIRSEDVVRAATGFYTPTGYVIANSVSLNYGSEGLRMQATTYNRGVVWTTGNIDGAVEAYLRYDAITDNRLEMNSPNGLYLTTGNAAFQFFDNSNTPTLAILRTGSSGYSDLWFWNAGEARIRVNADGEYQFFGNSGGWGKYTWYNNGTKKMELDLSGYLYLTTVTVDDDTLEDVLVRDTTNGQIKSRTVASIIAEVPEQEVATYGNF